MDDETWEDPAIADLVARVTVPVKVDADLRPDVYARYHTGGLPSVAVLDGDGAFVCGATYLTPVELQRFLDVAVAEWRQGRRPPPRAIAARPAPDDLVDHVVARLMRRADREHGGFGVAPKRPETEAVTLLLRRWRTSRNVELEQLVRAALDAVLDHLVDHHDGGFFRYAAGADWSGPHTEKLAIDQAQLARVLLEAGAALPEARYVTAARNALAHARRHLADRDGRVLSSVAADPAYYARTAHSIVGDGDRPPVDTRRFADAGAAMVSAAALCFAATGRGLGFASEYRMAAPSGVVPHRLDDLAHHGAITPQPAFEVPHRLDEPGALRGVLRDQALAISAALAEYRLAGDGGFLAWAERAAALAIDVLWDERASAFRSEPADAPGEVALPPMSPLLGNGEMAMALLDLAAHTDRAEYTGYAERVVRALAGSAAVSPAGAAIALAALRRDEPPVEVRLEGDPSDPEVRELARAAVAGLGPTAVVRWNSWSAATGAVPQSCAARVASLGTGAPRATVCASDVCLPPVRDAHELLRSLEAAGFAAHGILALWSSSSPDDEGTSRAEEAW